MLKKYKFNYQPTTKEEVFGLKIYFLLVDNFASTFLVGGTVRNILLGFNSHDTDIATNASPEEVITLLTNNKIKPIVDHVNFGVVNVKYLGHLISITSFRKEEYNKNRFPKIELIKNPEKDAKRRDFTLNSLYLSPKNNLILDYVSGYKDCKNKLLKFTGNPVQKIKEDPLRIIRGLRFALNYKLKFEEKSFNAIQKNFSLIFTLSKNKLDKEIKKVFNKKEKELLKKIIYTQKNLDTNFKRFII